MLHDALLTAPELSPLEQTEGGWWLTPGLVKRQADFPPALGPGSLAGIFLNLVSKGYVTICLN